MDVYHCVLDAFVSKDLLYVQEIAGAMIFHCAFPMGECCEVDFEKSGVSKSFSNPFALPSEVALHTTMYSRESSLTLLWKPFD